MPPAPESRDEILTAAGPRRAAVYHLVRGILDSFEEVARWENLYYPPTEIEEFLRIQRSLLSVIDEIPYRVWAMTIELLEGVVRDLVDYLPSANLDEKERLTLTALMDADALAVAPPEARESARRCVETLPQDLVAPSLKQLIRWLLDRHVPDAAELSGEVFDEALESLPEEVLSPAGRELVGNLQFYFDGIHTMTAGDVEKLGGQIHLFETGQAGSAQDRVFTCEIAADLKGKYSSAIMGAAANLVAEGRWNGAEVEPILFPEKAEEFERNELLVETLNEVLESIKKVPNEVNLVDIVETWNEGRRVDRYALSHLYGFLGSAGKLMKESSRRALYSGDYHQVQLRESRLSARVNELNMLHNKTWEVLQEDDASISECYPQMVDKTIQLAAVLDVELLKKLVGDEMVRQVLSIVSIEGEKRRTGEIRFGEDHETDFSVPETLPLREKVPQRLKPLIPLLHDEDLQTFLELLLGSVLKRASFAVKQRQEQTRARAGDQAREAAAEEALIEVETLDGLNLEILPEPEVEIPEVSHGPSLLDSSGAAAAAAEEEARQATAEKVEVLEKLQGLLHMLLSGANTHRKSFDLVHRLVSQKGMIPPAMLRSMLPFIEDLTDRLVPQLAAVSAQGAIPITYQSELTQYCRSLTRRDLTPGEIKTTLVGQMEGLLRLLADLDAETQEMIDTYSQGGGTTGSDLLNL